MNTYVLESLENGSHGVIPDEGINYFVGQNRITVHKDGKKVIDKEIDINPDGTISKYNLLCDDDKDPELKPVSDVEEYNVANMLPQVLPEGSVLRKDAPVEEFKVTDDHNTRFLEDFIKKCRKEIEGLKDQHVPDTDPNIQKLKARMWDAEKRLKAYSPHLVAASDNSIEDDGEEYEEITINDTMTEGVGSAAAIVGGVVVLTGVLAMVVEHEITKRKAVDWYAEEYEVRPKFSELTKKNYKVKYDRQKGDVELTDKEKKFNFDKNNVAEIYYYNDKRAFGVIYGCNVDSFYWTPGYTITNYKINVRVVVYDPAFKHHIEYYAAKSMLKHEYTMRSIDDWIRGITADYRKFKKAEKKAMKESDDLSLELLSDDLDMILENCNNILERISPYQKIEEHTSVYDGEFITETAADCVANLTEKHCDSIMKKYRSYCAKQIRKIDGVASVDEGNYKGWSIDIRFTKNDNISELEKLAKEEIVPVLNEAVKEFTKEYKSKFYWNDKVFTKDGLLITLDSDIYYDLKESTEIEEAAVPIDAVKALGKKIKKITKSEINKLEKFAKEKSNLLKDLKKETDKIKKNDIKRKLVKNQKDYRKVIEDFDADTKKEAMDLLKDVSADSVINQIEKDYMTFTKQIKRDSNDDVEARRRQAKMGQDAARRFNNNQIMNANYYRR